jgi:hypothetical protein
MKPIKVKIKTENQYYKTLKLSKKSLKDYMVKPLIWGYFSILAFGFFIVLVIEAEISFVYIFLIFSLFYFFMLPFYIIPLIISLRRGIIQSVAEYELKNNLNSSDSEISDAMKINISKIQQGFIGYKATYADRKEQKKYDTSHKNPNWTGMCIANKEKTAEGYLVEYIDEKTGNGTACIKKINLKNEVKLVTCLHERFKSGEKITELIPDIKEALRFYEIDVRDEQNLIPRLGELGYFFKCYNNDNEDMEIIIPENMISTVELIDYKKHVLSESKIESTSKL